MNGSAGPDLFFLGVAFHGTSGLTSWAAAAAAPGSRMLNSFPGSYTRRARISAAARLLRPTNDLHIRKWPLNLAFDLALAPYLDLNLYLYQCTMGVRDKPWLALPFLGSQSRPQGERRGSSTYATPANGTSYKPGPNGNAADFDHELTRQQTALDFAKKDEEDIVKDFNSPIHMYHYAQLAKSPKLILI